MRQLTDLSLVEIGRMFGGRDHSTVLYACARVGEQATTDNAFAERLNALFSTLATG
jgi:chromosomal replication initiator protein